MAQLPDRYPELVDEDGDSCIDAVLNAVRVTDVGGGGGGGPVTIADGADVTQGAIADAAVTGDSPGTQSGKLRGLVAILANVWDSVNNWLRVGINDAGNSISVDDGGSVLSTDSTDGAHATLGATSDADTANTVIGRLKKIVALLGGGLPAALSASGNLKVAVLEGGGSSASDTATLSNVTGATSSTTLLAANTSRLGAIIFNDSTARLFVKFGSTASDTSFTVRLDPLEYYEVPFSYRGIITGIWSDALGAARMTELTA